MDEPDPLRRVVITDAKDADGTVWRAVTLADDGSLLISGHDLGPAVERLFGFSEYEFERRLSAPEVSTLCMLLGVADDGDLLAAITARFASAHELEKFVSDHDIAGESWNRIGD